MFMNNHKVSHLLLFLFLSFFASVLELRAQRATDKSDGLPPKVLEARAPEFNPFVFGEDGVAEVVIKVTIDRTGSVTSATTESASLFKDQSFEDTAKRWLFEKDSTQNERVAKIKFILRIMPKETAISDITTIYRYPLEMEVRRPIIPSQITSSPLPIEIKKP